MLFNNSNNTNNPRTGCLGFAGAAAIILLVVGLFGSKALLIAGVILLVFIVCLGFVKSN